MITCTLRGQLGNQAFIIATTIAYASRTNAQYVFPHRSGKRNQFANYFSFLPLIGEHPIEGSRIVYREPVFGVYKEIPVLDHGCVDLQGYFQSEKYFKDYRKEVIEALCFPKYEMQYDTVAVHVRRGDYLRLANKHNVCSIEWLLTAMNQFDEGYKFKFFSDDIEWCKANFQGDKYSFSEGNNQFQDIGQIAACEHGIMSASTFGWWGNWIAENNNKRRRVYVPKDWFNPNYTKLRTDDIVPDNWIKL